MLPPKYPMIQRLHLSNFLNHLFSAPPPNFFTYTVVIVIIMCSSVPTFAASKCNPRYFLMWEHTKFKGKRIHGVSSKNIHKIKPNLGDKISSLCVAKDWDLTVFQHANYKGDKKTFRGPIVIKNLHKIKRGSKKHWGDTISSYTITSKKWILKKKRHRVGGKWITRIVRVSKAPPPPPPMKFRPRPMKKFPTTKLTKNITRDGTRLPEDGYRPSDNIPKVTVIMADKIEIGDEAKTSIWRKRLPDHFILIANEIHIKKDITFRANGIMLNQNPTQQKHLKNADAGSIAILTRKLICNGGTLRFNYRGAKLKNKWVGAGGDVFLAFEKTPKGEKCVETTGTNVDGSKPGSIVRKKNLKDFIMHRKESGGREVREDVISEWVIAMLDKTKDDISSAGVRNEPELVAKLFDEFNELIDVNKYPAQGKKYSQLLRDLDDMRDDLPLLRQETITLDRGGVPLEVQVFFDRTQKAFLVPTNLLVKVVTGPDGSTKLGWLDVKPENPDQINLRFDAQLTVDPWIESLLKKELENKTQSYGGTFSNWVLHAHPISSHEVEHSTINANGNNLSIVLTLETQSAGLALHYLNTTGLSLKFDWEYGKKKEIKGNWKSPPLVFHQRDSHQLVFDKNKIRNLSSTTIELQYIKNEKGDFVEISSTTISPQGIASINHSISKVYFEGIRYLDEIDPQKDFVVAKPEIMDTFLIYNKIGSNDTLGPLEKVEVKIEYITKGAESGITQGPFFLGPLGSDAADITVSFLKSPKSQGEIIVTGKAIYTGGSILDFKKNTTDKTIHLTKDILPSLEN